MRFANFSLQTSERTICFLETEVTARRHRIFLNYRREDAAGHAGRLWSDLSLHFGESEVFLDVDRIAPGEDFALRLQTELKNCGVVLVVIGSRWLEQHDGRRRIDEDDDYVRMEVRMALTSNLKIIPVLVHGAKIPTEEELPAEIRSLVRWQAISIDDARWKHDTRRLIDTIGRQAGIGRRIRFRPVGETTISQRLIMVLLIIIAVVVLGIAFEVLHVSESKGMPFLVALVIIGVYQLIRIVVPFVWFAIRWLLSLVSGR